MYLLLNLCCYSLGSTLCPNELDSLKVCKFHHWFYRGVAQWLDIALFKALQRVKKAVELDSLVPVDSSVKYSSSAVDTFAIFYQVIFFLCIISYALCFKFLLTFFFMFTDKNLLATTGLAGY